MRQYLIPLDERCKLVSKVFFRINLKNKGGNAEVTFVLCMISILVGLITTNTSSYMVLLNQLLAAVRSGKISLVILRAIVRKLQKQG